MKDIDGTRVRRRTVTELDGTHMGPAVNWWRAAAAGDPRMIETIRGEITAEEMLRSALEVVLSQVDWVARNDHQSWGDAGARFLDELGQDAWVRPSIRLLTRALSEEVGADPATTAVTVPDVPVEIVMDLVLLISHLVQSRFGVDTSSQLRAFGKQVLVASA